jgi:hypothetical protein
LRPKEKTVSVENIVRTYGRLCIKAIKMSPHHYKTVGKIFLKSVTTGSEWEQPINELLESNKKQLNPFIKEFYQACGCTGLVMQIDTEEFVREQRTYSEKLNQDILAIIQNSFNKENN